MLRFLKACTSHQNENDCDSTHIAFCLKLFPKQSESTFPRISHTSLQAELTDHQENTEKPGTP